MKISMDTLTNSQRNILNQFKESLADVLTPEYTDTTLIKWLRARNYNVKASEKIFREAYNQKILFRVNTIVDTYKKPEVVEKFDSHGILGFAKDGSLIRYSGAGRIDFYGFAMSMSSYDLCQYFSYLMESDKKALREENLKTRKNVEEVLYILDLEGFSISHILHKNVLESSLDFLRLFQDCYPEIWSHFLFVNAPTVFDAVFRILKPVLRGPLLEKMVVASKDSTRSVLLEYIDEDILPAFLGGNRVDCNGDPQCKEFEIIICDGCVPDAHSSGVCKISSEGSFPSLILSTTATTHETLRFLAIFKFIEYYKIKFSSIIPEKFYILNRSSAVLLTPEDPRTIAFVLGRRSVRNICVPIYQGGTIMKLKMRADNGSVGLATFYKEFGENPNNPEFPGDNEFLDEHDESCKFKMISIALRAQIHCAPIEMQLFLPNTGIYVLRLSNADNWFSNRKVMVQYDLIPPELESSALPGGLAKLALRI